MEKEIINGIKGFCAENGVEFVNDYSGRCMYGLKCIGVITNDEMDVDTMLSKLIYYLTKYEIIDTFDSLGAIRTDNMGLYMIIYFPQLSIEE